MDVRDFVTLTFMKVRLSVVHRPNTGEHVTVDRGKKERTRMGCNIWERVVMEDFAQGQSVIQARWNAFSFSWKFPAVRVFPREGRRLLPRHLRGRFCTQSTDSPALEVL